ncbi:MAG: dockerin type I domain-containing protein, partial [Bacteroidetes bacterium]|nr:dockerin type I domain-containing protein [Bacteroidota bacterium]
MSKIYTKMRYWPVFLIVIFLLLPGFARSQSLQLLVPNGSEVWAGASQQEILWDYLNVDNLRIEYSADSGLSWQEIVSAVPSSTLSYTWTVPGIHSTKVLVRITSILEDASDESDGVFTIPEQVIHLTYPTEAASFGQGTGQYISWESEGFPTIKVEYSLDNGTSWSEIITQDASLGYCNWVVPETLTTEGKVRIGNTDNPVDRDSSSQVFSITAMNTPHPAKYRGGSFDGYAMASSLSDSMAVINPNGGNSFYPSETVLINWYTRNVDNLKIEYTYNIGSTWNTILNTIPSSSGSFAWVVPNTPSNGCKVRISDIDGSPTDESDSFFSILPATITLTYPLGGESVGAGTGQYITWTSNGIQNVLAEYSTDGGNTWIEIATVQANLSYCNWTVPAEAPQGILIKVSDAGTPLLYSITGTALQVINLPQPTEKKYRGGSFDGYAMASSLQDSIHVNSPDGGETWVSATNQLITWDFCNVDNLKIEYSIDSGVSWMSIVETIPASVRQYSWLVPSTFSTLCKVRVSSLNGVLLDESDACFTIPPPWIEISYPEGGESFGAGTGQYLSWTSSGVADAKVEISADGLNWTLISTLAASNGYCNWVVPAELSNTLRLRVYDASNPAIIDSTNATISNTTMPVPTAEKYHGGIEPTECLAEAGPDVTISQGSSTTLNGSAIGGNGPFTFSWTPVSGLSNPLIPNPIASPSETTTYTLLVTGPDNCYATDVVTVNVIPAVNCFSVDAGPDQLIAPGWGAFLHATVDQDGYYQYLWSNGCWNSEQIVFPQQTTTYYVTVTNQYACVAYDSVMVIVDISPIITSLPVINSCSGVVAIPIIVSDFYNVASISLSLFVDPNILSYTGYQNLHPALANINGLFDANMDGNNFRMAAFSLDELNLGSDTLITLLFEATEGYSQLEWDLYSDFRCEYTDSEINILPAHFQNSSVTLISCNSISGNLIYENEVSTPLNNTEIFLKQNNEVVAQQQTDLSGHFLFNQINNGEYSLMADCSKPWGGVNAIDALLVLRHFVGTTPLNGLNVLAADVDATGYINASDALLIAKRFVGMVNSFNSGNWCIEKPIITVTGTGDIIQNMKALCFGDVDGSHNPASKTDFHFALSGQPTLIEKDHEEIIIPFYAQSAVSVGSVSFVADVPDYMEVTDVVIPSDEPVVFLQHGRELRIAWYSMDPLEVNAGEPLFSLRAHLVKEPQPPVVLELNPSSL